MKQIITANSFSLLVGEKRECVPSLLREIPRFFRRVNADRDGTYSYFLKLTQTLLNTPQLGVAEWSPVASIEDQQRALRYYVLGVG